MRNKILSGIALCALVLGGCSDKETTNPSITPNQTMTRAQLIGFQSCEELEVQLKGSLSARLENELRMQDNYYGGWMEDDMVAESGADGASDSANAGGGASDSGPREEGVDFSGTNNQDRIPRTIGHPPNNITHRQSSSVTWTYLPNVKVKKIPTLAAVPKTPASNGREAVGQASEIRATPLGHIPPTPIHTTNLMTHICSGVCAK